MRRHLTGMVASAAVAAGLAGCSAEPRIGRPMTAEQFAARNGVSLEENRPDAAVDRAGAVVYDPPRPAPQTPAPVSPDAQPTPGPIEPVSPAVKQAVSRPYAEQRVGEWPLDKGANGTAASATQPSAAPGVGGSQAIDVFFVVLDVNGRAIFSDKVLRLLEKPLAIEARTLDAGAFKTKANKMIDDAVRLMTREELEVAQAEKELEPAEKQMAVARTMDWRQKMITAAGGSLEVARRRALADGWDFDELAKQQERLFLVQQYYQRRIFSRAQAPASEIRAYYERNKEKEFSTPGKVKFRIIRIDPRAAKYASKQDAYKAADAAKARTATEDFAKVASDPEVNDDSLSRDRGGLARENGWVEANSYPFAKVEQAAFAMKAGEVSDVIEDEGKLFLVKTDEVQKNKVEAFEEQGVQDRISSILRNQQISALREKHIKALESQAVTTRRDGATRQLLEIVMQRYPAWSGKGS